MKKNILLIIILLLLFNFNYATAYNSKQWEKTVNEYISTVVILLCSEKNSPELKKCNIPTDRCKIFVDLVFKQCLGEEIAKKRPIKHPKDMPENELLNVLDRATVCTSKSIRYITFYVCPENYKDIYDGGGFKYKGNVDR